MLSRHAPSRTTRFWLPAINTAVFISGAHSSEKRNSTSAPTMPEVSVSACRISADVLLMLSLFVISPHFLNTLPPIGCIGEKLVHLRTRKKRKARKKHSRRLPTVLELSDVCEYSLLFFPEGEEALADVVEHHEQAHTAEHCDVFLDRGGKARQHPPE